MTSSAPQGTTTLRSEERPAGSTSGAGEEEKTGGVHSRALILTWC